MGLCAVTGAKLFNYYGWEKIPFQNGYSRKAQSDPFLESHGRRLSRAVMDLINGSV